MTTRRLIAAMTAAVNTPAYHRNARQIASQLAREDVLVCIYSAVLRGEPA